MLASIVVLAAVCVIGCGIQVTRVRVQDLRRKRKLGKSKKYRSVAENDDEDDSQGTHDIDTLDSLPDCDAGAGEEMHNVELR